MSPTDKQIQDFYKSKAEYEAKLDEALKTVPKVEELYRMISDLTILVNKQHDSIELLIKGQEKLFNGYENNKSCITKLETKIAVMENSESYEQKKVSTPVVILISIATCLITVVATVIAERYLSLLK